MAIKHHSKSYRDAGRWVCWCDGLNSEITLATVKEIRSRGFKVKREKDRVFVLADDVNKIDLTDLKEQS